MNMLAPDRRTLRAALAAAAMLIPVVVAPAASAAVVSYEGRCARTIDVVQWTPQKGAVARFIADKFASSGSGLWIGLGRTRTTFWSAEGGDPNDACDDCRELHLVETRSDGTRTRHKVFDSAIRGRVGSTPAAQKAHILGRLWKLARTTWPAANLAQDYTVKTGRPPAKHPDRDPSFTLEVTAKSVPGKAAAARDQLRLRYDFNAKRSMCWCINDWQAKRL